MTKYNLKKLDGIFGFSVFNGFLLSILFHTGLDISETGIALTILKTVTDSIGTQYGYLVTLFSIIAAIAEIFVMVYCIKQISEKGISGILVTTCGFFGTLSTVLGSLVGVQLFVYLGIILWFTGIIISRISD